jgi:hypothetical protein
LIKLIEIGKQENFTDKDIKLLYTPALCHDTGYILQTAAGHEEEAVHMYDYRVMYLKMMR